MGCLQSLQKPKGDQGGAPEAPKPEGNPEQKYIAESSASPQERRNGLFGIAAVKETFDLRSPGRNRGDYLKAIEGRAAQVRDEIQKRIDANNFDDIFFDLIIFYAQLLVVDRENATKNISQNAGFIFSNINRRGEAKYETENLAEAILFTKPGVSDEARDFLNKLHDRYLAQNPLGEGGEREKIRRNRVGIMKFLVLGKEPEGDDKQKREEFANEILDRPLGNFRNHYFDLIFAIDAIDDCNFLGADAVKKQLRKKLRKARKNARRVLRSQIKKENKRPEDIFDRFQVETIEKGGLREFIRKLLLKDMDQHDSDSEDEPDDSEGPEDEEP